MLCLDLHSKRSVCGILGLNILKKANVGKKQFEPISDWIRTD